MSEQIQGFRFTTRRSKRIVSELLETQKYSQSEKKKKNPFKTTYNKSAEFISTLHRVKIIIFIKSRINNVS